MSNTPPTLCPTCNKPPVDGCSRVECASRKTVTAVALGRVQYAGGLRRYTPPER